MSLRAAAVTREEDRFLTSFAAQDNSTRIWRRSYRYPSTTLGATKRVSEFQTLGWCAAGALLGCCWRAGVLRARCWGDLMQFPRPCTPAAARGGETSLDALHAALHHTPQITLLSPALC